MSVLCAEHESADLCFDVQCSLTSLCILCILYQLPCVMSFDMSQFSPNHSHSMSELSELIELRFSMCMD